MKSKIAVVLIIGLALGVGAIYADSHERMVMIWCGSTEVYLEAQKAHQDPDAFEKALKDLIGRVDGANKLEKKKDEQP